METSWSLHLLSEILSAFSTDDPENLRNVLNRVAESVDAEVAAIICDGQIDWCIGLAKAEQGLLLQNAPNEPPELAIKAGRLNTFWASLGSNDRLMVGRLGVPYDLEERSLLRAMGRSIELSLRLLAAISSERQARLDASYQASHDPLTDLPNRTLVLEKLSGWIDNPPQDGDQYTAVLFIDIDRFKWVNDAHGHAAGDEVLVHVSVILKRSVGQNDLVGRLSGDEFIVLTRTPSAQACTDLALRILTAIQTPIKVAGTELSHSASVGICIAEPHDTASSVIENADMAMYEAKALGRGGFALFEPRMRQKAQERLSLEEELRHAVGSGQIEAHLQPIVRLSDGKLMGFEALARWRHPEQGLLSPAIFIAAAEESGLIEQIDLIVLEAACQAVGRWQRLPGLGHLRVSSNLSGRTLGSPDLVAHIDPILAASGIKVAQVFLEITETSLVEDIPSTASTIERMRQLGVQLAIDDFGTGYSSLLYLKRFPVGLLKIDRSFVANLGSNPDDEAIARAILSLAKALGVEVVAEGVETTTQQEWLTDLHCAYGQGYLYGRPKPMATIEADLIKPLYPGTPLLDGQRPAAETIQP